MDIGAPLKRRTVIPLREPVRETPEPSRRPFSPSRTLPTRQPVCPPSPSPELEPVINRSRWRPDRPMTGKIGGNYAGVHAWKEREAARIMFEENMAGAGAWGAVALWGELVEHEPGFRAENARVVAIEAVRSSRHGHILGRVTDRSGAGTCN